MSAESKEGAVEREECNKQEKASQFPETGPNTGIIIPSKGGVLGAWIGSEECNKLTATKLVPPVQIQR